MRPHALRGPLAMGFGRAARAPHAALGCLLALGVLHPGAPCGTQAGRAAWRGLAKGWTAGRAPTPIDVGVSTPMRVAQFCAALNLCVCFEPKHSGHNLMVTSKNESNI